MPEESTRLSKAQTGLVTIAVGLVRTLFGNGNVVRLLVIELGEFSPDLCQMQPGNFLIQMLWQGVDLLLVTVGVGEEFDLGQRLIGKGGAHHKAWMTHGVS